MPPRWCQAQQKHLFPGVLRLPSLTQQGHETVRSVGWAGSQTGLGSNLIPMGPLGKILISPSPNVFIYKMEIILYRIIVGIKGHDIYKNANKVGAWLLVDSFFPFFLFLSRAS